MIFGMYHHLVDLYQVCSNFSPGPKMARPVGHMLYIGLYREQQVKILLSETTRHRALICGMYYHLVDLYQVCSNYSPGAKMDTPRGHMFNIGFYREQHEKIFLSETTRPRVLIFGMKHHLVDLYQICSN